MVPEAAALSGSKDNSGSPIPTAYHNMTSVKPPHIQLNFQDIIKDKELICPISKEMMKEPRILLPCQHVFDRHNITVWYSTHGKICPTCTQPYDKMAPELKLKGLIDQVNTLLDKMKQQNLSIDELCDNLPLSPEKDNIRMGIESCRQGHAELGLDIITEILINTSDQGLEYQIGLILNKLHEELSRKEVLNAAKFNSVSLSSSPATKVQTQQHLLKEPPMPLDEIPTPAIENAQQNPQLSTTATTPPKPAAPLAKLTYTNYAVQSSSNATKIQNTGRSESSSKPAIAKATTSSPQSLSLKDISKLPSIKKTDANTSSSQSQGSRKRPLDSSGDTSPQTKVLKTQSSTDVSKSKAANLQNNIESSKDKPAPTSKDAKSTRTVILSEAPAPLVQKEKTNANLSPKGTKRTSGEDSSIKKLLDAPQKSQPNELIAAIKEKKPIEHILGLITKENVNSTDEEGNTPLHLVPKLFRKSSEMLKKLIKKGANVNQQNHKGETPLHVVAPTDKLTPIKFLCKKKADKSLRTKEGKTPFELAIDVNIQKLLKI